MMKRMLRSFFAAGAASLLIAGAALAAGTSVPDLDLGALRANLRYSAVWYGDQQQPAGSWSGENVGRVQRFGLVAYWGSRPTSLPIDLGNGLKLTVYGDFEIYAGSSSASIEIPNPQAGITHTDSGMPVIASAYRQAGSGRDTIGWRANLWPVLYCSSTPCVIESGPMRIQTLKIGIRDLSGSGVQGAESSDQIIVYGGTPLVKSSCDFSVSPTSIDFGTVRQGFEGDLLARKETYVTASCSRAEPGSIYIRLDPVRGIDASDTHLTTFSPELGLRYNLNADVTCSRSGSLPWGSAQTQKLGDLGKPWWSWDVIRPIAFIMNGEGMISWGVCQLKPNVPAGTYRTSVNYTIWVD